VKPFLGARPGARLADDFMQIGNLAASHKAAANHATGVVRPAAHTELWRPCTRPRVTLGTLISTAAPRSTAKVTGASWSSATHGSMSYREPGSGWRGRSALNHKIGRRGQPHAHGTRSSRSRSHARWRPPPASPLSARSRFSGGRRSRRAASPRAESRAWRCRRRPALRTAARTRDTGPRPTGRIAPSLCRW
jgi:hypothetical protein